MKRTHFICRKGLILLDSPWLSVNLYTIFAGMFKGAGDCVKDRRRFVVFKFTLIWDKTIQHVPGDSSISFGDVIVGLAFVFCGLCFEIYLTDGRRMERPRQIERQNVA